ncbi:MAG: DUF3825 domain-containing protein [Lachnospiraceae bacterium]|nr:DUF3825 domain-containing protein [Lachnospiraceae bacterium]
MKLFEFAYCGNYRAKLGDLAVLAPEKWSFGDQMDNSILKNYIDHTFSKLYDENKVVEEADYAIFNTGLFDTYYKPICAYFIKHTAPDRQKWYLDGFYTEYQIINMGVTSTPERANYFSDPSELVFDTHLDIVPQYDHIFGDQENIDRLPASVRNSAMRVQMFNGAIETTKRMLEANYKTAIPQYYRGKMQLLVPICLQNPNKPDLALTCVKTEDKSKYLGRTCLTLEMAYNNARLIAKPESNWLQA